jgi:hypothetical protein
MGRHSAMENDAAGMTPGGAPKPWSSVRLWTRRHKVLTAILGSIVAAFVIMAAVSAALGGGQTGNRPSGSVAAEKKPPVGAFGSSLAELPVRTALTGSEAIAWADAALAALGAPTTTANVRTMVDWFANEGTPHNLNNPLNLQTPYGGSIVSTADGDPVSDGIQAYTTPAGFVAAFPIEMKNGSYPAIVEALKAGTGLEGSAATPEIAAELSAYSGGGYNSIPAAYNQ